MSLLLNKNIVLVFILLTAFVSKAQLISVEDPVLRSELCSQFPLAMSGDCLQLDTVKASSVYPVIEAIHFSSRKITNADEVIYFKNADTINLNGNELTSFPDDLSGFRSLDRLHLANNKLTVAPTIKYTNAISGDTAVKLVYLQYNQISTLPDSWYDYNSKTQVIDLRFNQLDTIPNFNNYTQLRRLEVSQNNLGFEELIPLLSIPPVSGQELVFFPQNTFDVEIDTLVKIGDVLTINVSTSLASNTYRLLMGDRTIENNETGVFEIEINSEEDLGEYWFKVFNSNFTEGSDFLQSKKYTLTIDQPTETPVVEPSPVEGSDKPTTYQDLVVFSPNDDGVDDFYTIEGEGAATFYDKNGQELRMEELPYSWYGDDKNGRKLEPGLYIVKVNQNSYIKILIAY